MKTLKSQNKSFSQEIYTWYSLFGRNNLPWRKEHIVKIKDTRYVLYEDLMAHNRWRMDEILISKIPFHSSSFELLGSS